MQVHSWMVGEIVAIQLARPMYVFNYLAHALWENQGSAEQILLQRQEQPCSGLTEDEFKALVSQNRRDEAVEPVMRDHFTSVKIITVQDQTVTFEIPLPSNVPRKVHMIHKTVGFENIVSIDMLRVSKFQAEAGIAEQRDVPSRIVGV